MRTPRELLLHHHRAVDGRLANRLAAMLARELPSARTDTSPTRSLPLRLGLRAWDELFWSCRRAWCGLAAAWVLIAGLQLLSGETLLLARLPFNSPSSADASLVTGQLRLVSEAVETLRPPAAAKPALPPARRSALSGTAMLRYS